jgi:hypothetical protein
MLHFYKFCPDVPTPEPARETYHKRQPGKGWPEECPPMRAANSFGWDLLNPTDLQFRQIDGKWTLETPVTLESDWVFAPSGEPEDSGEDGVPVVQDNAWFWDQDQMLPHVISSEVYEKIDNQVKVSTLLYLKTDPNELLAMGDLPNLDRPFRVLSALVDADWYPASYPWHCVLELDRDQETIRIEKGEPLCRVVTVRRDNYFAREMTLAEFETFFQRGQEWLSRHGRGGNDEGTMDITRTYVKQQRLSRFSVIL